MNDKLKKETLIFLNFLKNKKIKNKDSVLIIDENNKKRINLYRTDIIKNTLTESDFKKINEIFKDFEFTIDNYPNLIRLLNNLIKNKILIRVSRIVEKDQIKLLKWPKQCSINTVI